MAKDVYRQCSCRDENKKQWGAACPDLADPKHGTWGYYLAGGIDPATGKRLQYRKRGFATKKAAQIARNAVAVKVDKGLYVAPTKETYSEYLDKWLPRRAATGDGLEATTVYNYARYIKNDIKPSALGAMALTDIRRFHINGFIEGLTEAGRGAVTVRRIVAVVQGSLRTAARANRIDHNPATELELPKAAKADIKAWEPEQVGQFLDEATKHRLGALFELDMFTGLRRAEIVGLRWKDVNLASRTVKIASTRVQAGKVVVEKTTKNTSSRRILDLDDLAVGALIAWQIKQQSEAAEWADAWEDTGYVFTYENGQPLKPQYVTRLFDKLRVKAELPKLTFHGARHEHASLMIAAGTDIAVVSKRLGHSSISITSDIYGHLIGSASRTAAENAAALVPRKKAVAQPLHNQGTDSSSGQTKNRPSTGLLPSV